MTVDSNPNLSEVRSTKSLRSSKIVIAEWHFDELGVSKVQVTCRIRALKFCIGGFDDRHWHYCEQSSCCSRGWYSSLLLFHIASCGEEARTMVLNSWAVSIHSQQKVYGQAHVHLHIPECRESTEITAWTCPADPSVRIHERREHAWSSCKSAQVFCSPLYFMVSSRSIVVIKRSRAVSCLTTECDQDFYYMQLPTDLNVDYIPLRVTKFNLEVELVQAIGNSSSRCLWFGVKWVYEKEIETKT